MAIMNPLRPRMGRRTTLCIALGIWVLGTALSLPNMLVYTTGVFEYPNGGKRIVCYQEWPDGPSSDSYQENM
jgi:tachykinin-like receptor